MYALKLKSAVFIKARNALNACLIQPNNRPFRRLFLLKELIF